MHGLGDLERLLGKDRVRNDAATLAEYGADPTENPESPPDAVVSIATLDELIGVVRLAAGAGVPLVPRVAGTNLGGLTIPGNGGWVLDLRAMNRIVDIHFRRADPAERARVRACNAELCDALLSEGFVMYKTPGWALERYKKSLDPGFLRLLTEARRLLDPSGIMNPGRWNIAR